MLKIKNKNLKIPAIAVIFFSLLLTITSFYSGLSYSQSRNNGSQSSSVGADDFAIEKSKTPELKFFVMSFCPYGNQMEDILRPVFDLIGNNANIQPQYIFDKIDDLDAYCKTRAGDVNQCAAYVDSKYFSTLAECQETVNSNFAKCTDESAYIKASTGVYYASLHGRVEANQNIREICAWNQVKDKKQWWDFIANVNKACDSQNADTCWQEQADKAGLDSNKITECFNQEAIDLIEKEVALTEKYEISGSPTLLLNGVKFPPESAYKQDGTGILKVGKKSFSQDKFRTPDFIKEAVCAGFNKAPADCKKEISEPATAAAAGGC